MDSTVSSSPLLPRPFLSGGAPERSKRMKEECAGASSMASPSTGVAGEERRKRFPILGPTRQQTEMYFRNRGPRQRCSVADRVKAEARRQLVTRSADRVILPESPPTPRQRARPSSGVTPTPTLLTPTTPRATNNVSQTTATHSTDATMTTHKMAGISVGRHQAFSKDCEEAVNGTSVCHKLNAAPGTGSDRSAASGCLPGADPQGSLQSAATSSPALVRLENSPEQSCASLPLPAFQHLRHASTGGCTQRGLGGGRKKAEMSNLCEQGQQQSSHVARVRREQTHKTMQPSKHGFHLRSKSPTFKRLVAATEKLQDTVTGPDKSGPRADRFSLRAAGAGKASPGGIILPAVAGVWDGEAVVEERGEEEEEESDEDVTYLHPHPFLSSLPHTAYRSKLKSAGGEGGRRRLTRSVSTSMSSNPKHLDTCRGPDPSLIHGLGAWEVSSVGMEGLGDPVLVPVASLTSSSRHTELHLFLPRLADTLSEDGSSKLSPDHLCSRPAENRTANDVQRGKTMPHILPSHHPPQRSHTLCQQAADRSGRPQDRKFTSPLRVVRRDKTPNNRRQVMATPLVESYASYEPYLKGEHLKEKLEDLPTLISLDQE